MRFMILVLPSNPGHSVVLCWSLESPRFGTLHTSPAPKPPTRILVQIRELADHKGLLSLSGQQLIHQQLMDTQIDWPTEIRYVMLIYADAMHSSAQLLSCILSIVEEMTVCLISLGSVSRMLSCSSHPAQQPISLLQHPPPKPAGSEPNYASSCLAINI